MTDLMCLALAIFIEARGESLVGQISVAKVIQNRMARESATACEVISRKNQFPWFDKLLKSGDIIKIKQKPDFKNAVSVAKLSFESTYDPTNGATFFHGKKENPSWAKKLKLTLVEGGHKFYKET